MEKFNYDEWNERYHNKEIIDIKKYLNGEDIETIHILGIKTYDKIYTEYELEVLEMELLAYYEYSDEELSKEEKQYQKTLDGTNVSRERYNSILKKVEEMKIHS